MCCVMKCPFWGPNHKINNMPFGMKIVRWRWVWMQGNVLNISNWSSINFGSCLKINHFKGVNGWWSFTRGRMIWTIVGPLQGLRRFAIRCCSNWVGKELCRTTRVRPMSFWARRFMHSWRRRHQCVIWSSVQILQGNLITLSFPLSGVATTFYVGLDCLMASLQKERYFSYSSCSLHWVFV